MTNQRINIVKRCPECDWRILDKVTPTSGIIEMKCPNCHRIVKVDLSYRRQQTRRIMYRLAYSA